MQQLRCKHMTLSDWEEIIHFINPNLEILNEVPPQVNTQDIICHCTVCNGTFKRTPLAINSIYYKKKNNQYNANWCPVCTNRTAVVGINDLATLRPDLIEYFQNPSDAKKVVLQSGKIIALHCPICHIKKKMRVQQLVLYGFKCSCNYISSYPNKFCRALLSVLPVEDYSFEYSDTWSEGKRYDGYFKYNENEYLLEFDGRQHFGNTMWGTYESQRKNDKLKDNLASINGFILIRIDCKESSFTYIKDQIYNSPLAELFDLDLVDWDFVFQIASIGPLKEIADYYNTHEIMNKDIAEQLCYSPTKVKTYLKRAREVGLIKYKSNKYKKDYAFLRELCEFFIKNQSYSNTDLAKKFNTSTARICSYLREGLNEKIIDISQFTEDAYKGTRFSDLLKEDMKG